MSDAVVHAEEVRRVLAFLAVVGAIWSLAAIVLLRRVFGRPRVHLRAWSRAVLAVAAAGLLCIVYARLIEPKWIEVTQTRVPTSRLPAGHRGVRIVHLSDLHSDPEPLVEDRLPKLVASLRPDLIVFTGDAANSEDGVPVFRRCLTEIAKIAPTFCVKGNWDAWYFPEIDRFAGTGATLLEGTTASLDVAGATVHLIGAGFGSALDGLGAAFAQLPADGPAVMLYHPPYPDVVPARSSSRIDLMCAGHVHGGQVALPFYGALITYSKYGKQYERGLYRTEEGFPLYVNRGIGMEGGPSPRVRFCSRPEVALLELVPTN